MSGWVAERLAVVHGDRPIVVAAVSDFSSGEPRPHLLDINHSHRSVIWSLFDSLVSRGPDWPEF